MDKQAATRIVTEFFPGAMVRDIAALAGGVSANVYRLSLQKRDGTTANVVLREHGESHSGHPADVEFALLQALHEKKLAVPEPLYVDATRTKLPNPYLIMAFVKGSTDEFLHQRSQYIGAMAHLLADIHATSSQNLPKLPIRRDPYPELLDFLPKGDDWLDVHAVMQDQINTADPAEPKLLHGDFWPGNILWQGQSVAAILDWEDAALGDPLSDVACCQLELRYKFGPESMTEFSQAYTTRHTVDQRRLNIWQVYVAAAAQNFVGAWGLPKNQEKHIRHEALATIREACMRLAST